MDPCDVMQIKLISDSYYTESHAKSIHPSKASYKFIVSFCACRFMHNFEIKVHFQVQ